MARNMLLTQAAPALVGMMPRASQKSTLTNIYFHGDSINLFSGMEALPADKLYSNNDRFAMQYTMIRWPRVCRIIASRHPSITDADWIAAATTISAALTNICVAVGRADGAVAAQQWLREPTPNYGGIAASTYAGDILTFIFTSSVNQAYGLSGAAPNASYSPHYTSWSAMYDRHTTAAVHWYQSVSGGGGPEEVAESAVNGDTGGNSFGTLGPYLSTLGWTLHNASTHETTGVPTAAMIAIAQAFFSI